MNTAVAGEHDGLDLVAGVVHAHTSVSDGALSPEGLVAYAHERGLGVVCITDHHDDDWAWRLGLRLKRPSVVRHGVAAYLRDVAAAARTSPGPVVVAGVEIQPHYRWEGPFPFLRCEAMKTIVAYGLDAEAIETLPVRLDGRGRDEAEALVVAQAVIDSVRERGGVSYWSYLEHDERASFGTAALRLRPRPELLARTRAYTGFGCLPAGREATRPGGTWDVELARSAGDATFAGPWVIGESDFHSVERSRDLCDPATVFLLDRLDAAGVLDALARGRTYAYAGAGVANSRLDRFRVVTPRGTGLSGDVVRCGGPARLEVVVSGFASCPTVRVVRDGRVEGESTARDVTMDLPAPEGAAYPVRVEVATADEVIVSNPIFVAPGEGRG